MHPLPGERAGVRGLNYKYLFPIKIDAFIDVSLCDIILQSPHQGRNRGYLATSFTISYMICAEKGMSALRWMPGTD